MYILLLFIETLQTFYFFVLPRYKFMFVDVELYRSIQWVLKYLQLDPLLENTSSSVLISFNFIALVTNVIALFLGILAMKQLIKNKKLYGFYNFALKAFILYSWFQVTVLTIPYSFVFLVSY
jgi:hypothetical protein